MKIFYHPCHCSLEYDEVKILSGLGHKIFSTGVYKDPTKVKETIAKVESRFAHDRPIIGGIEPDEDLIAEFDKLNPNFTPYTTPNLTGKFLSNFDLIYISHDINLLQAVIGANLSCRVLYNTVSQVHPNYEAYFKQVRSKLKIMRRH